MRSVLIIGGGPAGCAAATVLAGAGANVTVLERSPSPADKVCGDFLSGEAADMLAALGLDPAGLGAAPIRRLRLIHRDHQAEVALPFPAYGVSRRSLDAALLGLAASAGAVIERGRMVREVREHQGKLLVRSAGSDEQSADAVFLATGKHDLRDLPRPGRGKRTIGFKTYFRLAGDQHAALGNVVELVLFAGGYAGLQRVEGGRAVLCLTMQGQLLPDISSWPTLLQMLQGDCPHLKQRLAHAEPLLEKPLAIAGTPYGFLCRPVRHAPSGLFRLGDQACVIPSLTGDGVAIALHSGRLAAETWLRSGNDAAAYHRRLRWELLWQMQRAMAAQRLCTRPAMQAPLVALSRLWPAAPRLAARWTRLRMAALPE